jgi:dihydroorotate dehydrogenase
MTLLSYLTKILHFMPGEISHNIALLGLKFLFKTNLLRFLISIKGSSNEKTLNIKINNLSNLKNRLGIAAGLDKNGDYIDCLASLGIGFIEVGTVTPRPQKGNPKPRIFRNIKEKSLLNRLGFNNKGVDHLVKKLKNRKTAISVGTSIGKNYDTPNEMAYKDYLFCLDKVYEFSDYIAVNISSPNTKGLRQLSDHDHLDFLLSNIKSKQNKLSKQYGYKPIFIKISPDESLHNLKNICRSIMDIGLDGVICCNTTADHNNKNGLGGISGAPLRNRATEKLIEVKKIIGDIIPVIASGGVMSALDYQEKIEAGADLVQIYTGFIYEGPKLVEDVLKIS